MLGKEVEAMPGFIYTMKLGSVYRTISPDGWRPLYAPEIPPGKPEPSYPPRGIRWKYTDYKPGEPLIAMYYLAGFPENPADAERWVPLILGKNPTKADVLELRESVAAYFGLPPQTASVKRFAEQQRWYAPKSSLKLSDLGENRQAVLARFDTIADCCDGRARQ